MVWCRLQGLDHEKSTVRNLTNFQESSRSSEFRFTLGKRGEGLRLGEKLFLMFNSKKSIF